jgi:hypothetical protein
MQSESLSMLVKVHFKAVEPIITAKCEQLGERLRFPLGQ